MSKAARLSDLIAKPFYGVHNDIHQHRHTYYWFNGGRGSLKSSTISLEIPLLMVKNPNVHAVVLRKVGNTIKTSVFPQMMWALDRLGMLDKFKLLTSPHEMIFRNTGQKIMFLGVDDPQKVKSIKVPFGYIGIVFFEELSEFAGIEEIRSLNQSLLRGGDKFWEFCSYNPPRSVDNWVNAEALLENPDRLVHHSTYLDAPREWLGEQFFEDANALYKRNEMAYRHEYLGEITGTGGAVFENVRDVELTDEQVNGFDRLYYGVDFGFSTDPLAFLAIYHDKSHNSIYLFNEVYGTKIKNKQAVERILPIAEHRRVIADSAEPRTISEFRDLGLNIIGAKKGPDSIDYGIKWLQSLDNIFIDKKRCPNAYREFVGYEYARDKSGMFISAYPDRNNHSIDACLTGDTLVETVQGRVPLERMVGKRSAVYCYDAEKKQATVSTFHDCRLTRHNADIYEVEMKDDRKFKATNDHPVLTQRGWVAVHDLYEGDCIVDISLLFRDGSNGKQILYVPVCSVRRVGMQDVYNMEVDNYHNFAVSGGLIVHNCRYATEELTRKPLEIRSGQHGLW